MSLRQLPECRTFDRPQNYCWDTPNDVLEAWSKKPLAAADEPDNAISMYDVIGEDFWSGGGVTAKRVAAALRTIGGRDVVVNINSPGGDLFEGIAIYNQLRAHPHKVTVNVLGWAASAASVIAMAGDEINMGLGSFMMVHNAWGMVVGNRHDMRQAAELFDQFDSAIVDIYEARTGLKRAEIEKLMDAETFMGPGEAVDRGFADNQDNSLAATASGDRIDRALLARRQTEAALAKAGVPRKTRAEMFLEMGAAAARDAGGDAERDAGFTEAALRLINTMRP